MARRRSGRAVSGILLLDKSTGMTSNKALQIAKRLFSAQKAGHTGSLDPLATGMLPLCFGEATKVSGFLLDADKSYTATCKLGVKTNSADSDGEVIQTRPVSDVDEGRIQQVVKSFLGDISQIPPMHSAIKQNGVPLYKLAHQGLEVAREPRNITIHEIRLVRLENDVLEIFVRCTKGTYIRTLADDIGEALGCGAHITSLRREGVEPFEHERMVTLMQLEKIVQQGVDALDQLLLPADIALKQWPAIELSSDAAFYVKQGQAVFVPKAPGQGLVRLYQDKAEFMGIGVVMDDGKIAPKRLMNMANQGKIRLA